MAQVCIQLIGGYVGYGTSSVALIKNTTNTSQTSFVLPLQRAVPVSVSCVLHQNAMLLEGTRSIIMSGLHFFSVW